jgi:hypothetical protein
MFCCGISVSTLLPLPNVVNNVLVLPGPNASVIGAAHFRCITQRCQIRCQRDGIVEDMEPGLVEGRELPFLKASSLPTQKAR